jgi:hypothetical protein
LLDGEEDGNVVRPGGLTVEAVEPTVQQMVQSVTDDLRGISISSLTSVFSAIDGIISRGDMAAVKALQVIDKAIEIATNHGGIEI